MRQRSAFAFALLLGAVLAQPAFATGFYHMKLASAEIDPANNSPATCQRISQNTPTGTPYTAIRCASNPSAPFYFTITTTFPYDVAAGVPETVTSSPHFWSPDASPVGVVCLRACYGVVDANNSRNGLNLSQCSDINQYPLGADDFTVGVPFADQGPAPWQPVTPKDTNGNSCGTAPLTNCWGRQLVIKYTVFPSSQCTNHTFNAVDFVLDDLGFNP